MANEPWQPQLSLSQGRRGKLVYDIKSESAKKRKTKGINALRDRFSEDEDEGH